MPTFIVRTAPRSETNQVRGFYNALAAGTIILNSHELQTVYVVENEETNQIVAAVACCAHCDGRFVEVGQAIIRLDSKGYGLHRLLTLLCTAKTLAMTNEGVQVFCIVDPMKQGLRDRMRTLGFDDCVDPPSDLMENLERGGYSADGFMFFNRACIADHVQSLLITENAATLRHIASPVAANLVFSTMMLSDPHFRETLETTPPA